MFSDTYYSQNYASIIRPTLLAGQGAVTRGPWRPTHAPGGQDAAHTQPLAAKTRPRLTLLGHCRAVHNPIAFSQLRSFARHLQPLTQILWLPVWDAIFIVICTHAHLRIT